MKEINTKEVARDEVLSDQVYFYDPETDHINYLISKEN